MMKLTFKLNGRTVAASQIGVEMKRLLESSVTKLAAEAANKEARRRGITPRKIVIKQN